MSVRKLANNSFQLCFFVEEAEKAYKVLIKKQACSFLLILGVTKDPSTDPYVAGKHLLLAHANAKMTYDNKYRDSQRGKV